ncbi:MAG: glycerol-3-phosphate acyltransferase [Anaerolineales bacterium]|jgi:glycerol-3-phosphate acyltransferase PlsY|nr:glycerol-3-phosphate acyltransferase [Anaerolineales bacterium]
MEILLSLVVVFLSYLIGSIPFGLLIVKAATGKDIRRVESGRTGGTNAFRAAGIFAGAGTAVLDFFKGFIAVYLARWLIGWQFPGAEWMAWVEVVAPIAAILGHNYSIFLSERDANGKLRLRGGAGGATGVGGAAGLWFPSALFIIPIGLFILFVVGYASLATMSFALVAIGVFAYRAIFLNAPWEYILYGVIAEVVLMIALRPNIIRLMKGTERLVGLRAKRAQKKNA